ncbi:ectonucleoside triphosphate diphosphohydrolase 5-like [Hyposmocoma kahamanoa]|uniref:ectonucleoside triphosphate diphosphohydrolase 5-like n=1 Tax=Hyposmocoma kahamanoa TaxID=1477025 RepID=UPI000E6D5D03|nr:ectonucleoside triphosphate diphosphohydrolase 5-like [Hyposmocoma kahamanoa]
MYELLVSYSMMSNDTPSLDTGDVYYVLVVDAGSTASMIHAYKFSLPTGRRRQNTLGKKNPLSSLEMGEVSAQVTFALNPDGNSNHLSKDEFVRPAVFNRTLYSHSYLGLGIEEARFGTLQLEAGDVRTESFISVCPMMVR